jgi:hypothetical protein
MEKRNNFNKKNIKKRDELEKRRQQIKLKLKNNKI